MIRRALSRFIGDRKANVAITFAFSLLPLVFLAGMTIDYTSASRKQAKLDAIADGAALAALTPANIHNLNDQQTAQVAQAFFNAQASSISGLNYNSQTNPTVTVTDTITTRTVTVSYTASSQNFFSGVLNLASISLSGSSQATGSFPPNIDFYLLLDNSPSMAIAATSAGITTMVNNTSFQGGCAFACHESAPQFESATSTKGTYNGLQNVNAQGKIDNSIDNAALAQQLGVVTRMQLVASAVSQLATTATNTAAENQATYRMATYTFYSTGAQAVTTLTSNLSTVSSQAQNIDITEVYTNNCLTSSNCSVPNPSNCTGWKQNASNQTVSTGCGRPQQGATGNGNNDTDTDFGQAMSDMISTMPAPGTGLNGSTPQEVLFIVSDGVDDVNSPSPACTQPLDGTRCQQPFNTTWCTKVKNAGIRIAVLYTVYLPMTTNSWYNSWIAPFQDYTTSPPNDNVGTNMQNCASPGLFSSVTTDGDIAAALNNLFQQAVQMAHLTQ